MKVRTNASTMFVTYDPKTKIARVLDNAETNSGLSLVFVQDDSSWDMYENVSDVEKWLGCDSYEIDSPEIVDEIAFYSENRYESKYSVSFEANWMQLILSREPFEDDFNVLDSVADMEYYRGSHFQTKEEIRLYAESDLPYDDEADDYSEYESKLYEELKNEIIEQAKSAGVPVEKLEFYYD